MLGRAFDEYAYYLLGDTDEYGQQTQTTEPAGTIKAAIYERQGGVLDSPLYAGTEYVSLTAEPVADNVLIQYGGELLKVLYCMPRGMFCVSFLKVTGR